MKRIYLDYAALAPIDPRVISEMKRYSHSKYGNPSSIYAEGVAGRTALDDSRKLAAAFLGCHADEIVFTSGGTESNALALQGAAMAARKSGIEKPHLIISSIEHSSIMETASILEGQGIEVTRLPVSRSGQVDLPELNRSIGPSTYMVSVMAVNNEIGSIEPIREIAAIVRKARKRSGPYPLFHSDACQAALYMDLQVEKMGVDMLTLDSSKACGPRGTGLLYVRRNVPVEPLTHGGGQEMGLRSGTENIPSIRGFVRALNLASALMTKERARIEGMRSEFMAGLEALNQGIIVNGGVPGSEAMHIAHILNVSIPGIDNEFFVLQLDAAGIAASTKSSCLRDAEESYVLKAIGADSRNSVRFSFGRWTRRGHVKKALKVMAHLLGRRS